MNPYGIAFSPERTIDWHSVQFAEYGQVETQDFSNIQYFRPSDEEDDEEQDDDEGAPTCNKQ